ncbi:MAG TPA: efflux RND transporter periplasmic adaptor subunit [Fibrobacteria bacterium]|nr:efflux RND transporter periplasmic adaptor subunit [Fibrobacteria bacterium]
MKTDIAKNILLLTAICGLAACQQGASGGKAGGPSQGKSQIFPTEVLTLRPIDLQSTFPATLMGKDEVEVKPRVEGTIEAVYVEEGAHVRKGQRLFRINSPSSTKALQQAQAQYATATLDVERTRPLAEKGIVSKVSLSAYENALASAKAALQDAKASMGWVTVTSPVDGLVGTIGDRVGNLVTTATTLTTVSNTTDIVAYFSLDEKDLYRMLGQWKGSSKAEKLRSVPPLRFVLSDGTTYPLPGRIETISGKIDPSTGSVSVRAIFPNRQGLLFSGTSGQVVLPDHRNAALVIPQKATFSLQDKVLVYAVEGDSAMQRNIVVEALADGRNDLVDSGLVAGERIATDGIVNLSNGQKIKFR